MIGAASAAPILKGEIAMDMLRMEGITKIYPNGFIANQNISLCVRQGEIHGLVGENGAGKTTLMKILFGMEDAQEGSIYIKGEKVKVVSPLDAIDKGIGMVHQHFMLLNTLTVAENVVLGIEPMKFGLFDFEKAVRMTQEIADTYSFRLDSRSKVEDLSVGVMQKVEILKALIKGAQVLILDEPTAVLTPQETQELFVQLKLLRESGHSIIFISHKLDEIMSLCDRVTVLRRGKSAGPFETEGLSEEKISRLIVGRDVVLKMEKEIATPGKVLMDVNNLVVLDGNGRPRVNKLTLTVRAGEVVGIAGVEGNGQKELSDAISGMGQISNGSVTIDGNNIANKSVRQIRELGFAHIPEDRMTYGCAANLSIKENIISDRFTKKEFKKGIFINQKYINQTVDEYIKTFEIACDDRNQPVRMLSGGNIQKVVVAREFTSGAKCILINQPTRGIDVGTAEMIRKHLLHQVRKEHVGALLISADLNEVLEVSDRLLVMRKGSIVAAFPQANKVSEEELGEYMLGLKTMTQEEMEGLL